MIVKHFLFLFESWKILLSRVIKWIAVCQLSELWDFLKMKLPLLGVLFFHSFTMVDNCSSVWPEKQVYFQLKILSRNQWCIQVWIFGNSLIRTENVWLWSCYFGPDEWTCKWSSDLFIFVPRQQAWYSLDKFAWTIKALGSLCVVCAL